MLERESIFYDAHQAEFREKYLRKWLVIAGESLFGVYDTPKNALAAAREHFKDGEFMLHRPANDDMVIEVGPMGVVHLHRPYDPEEPKPKPVITTSSGSLMKFAYA